ncbi:WYL domain-containing protein [Buchananella felis]|uniref:helix-turn-helix transcriptional regulator n=1 Tax=Buchananella felis TaxID=3231492 RepID=UPI003526F1CF
MTEFPPSADRASERVMDLLIALFHARRPLSRAQIYQQVNGYEPMLAGAEATAQNMMFERDKQALKDIGVPLRVSQDATHGDDVRYWVDPDSYVLDLPPLTPAQHGVLAVAAGMWQATDLAGPAARALTKLRALSGQSEAPWTVRASGSAHPYLVQIFAAVDAGAALSFSYRKGTDLSGPVSRREVEPWATWQVSGAWYLRGYDRDRKAARNFRLSRIVGAPKLVAGPLEGPGPDQSESGRAGASLFGEERLEAVVELAAGAGKHLRRSALCLRVEQAAAAPTAAPAAAPATAGMEAAPATGASDAAPATTAPTTTAPAGRERLRLELGNSARAVEDLCALGSDALVVCPPQLARAVAASHAHLAGLEVQQLPAPPAPKAKRKGRTAAVTRLTRMLALLTYLESHGPTRVSELAARFGAGEAEIERDVSTLFVSGRPGYYPDDLIDVALDDEGGQATLSLLDGQGMAKPLRLSALEATSLAAALRVLLAVSGDDPLVAQTLAAVQGQLPGGGAGEAAAAPLIVGERSPHQTLTAVRLALQEGRVLAFDYTDALERTSQRSVTPLELTADGEHHLLQAWCHDAGAERTFRLDRMGTVSVGQQAPAPLATAGQGDDAAATPPGEIAVSVLPAPSGWWIGEQPIASPCAAAAGAGMGEAWVELRAFNATWLERQLLGWGRHIAAWGAHSEAGTALLERVRQRAAGAARAYDER